MFFSVHSKKKDQSDQYLKAFTDEDKITGIELKK
jgi:hypothetical protein